MAHLFQATSTFYVNISPSFKLLRAWEFAENLKWMEAAILTLVSGLSNPTR